MTTMTFFTLESRLETGVSMALMLVPIDEIRGLTIGLAATNMSTL